MADDSVELFKATTEAGVESFFRTVCSPLVEAGEWGAHVIRRQRVKTQVKTIVRAERMLAEAGLSARVVPAKTLVPLLELAGLEDEQDADMQERWAALLANAATHPEGVMPAFAQILSELMPIEARMLDALSRSPSESMDIETFAAQGGWESYPPAEEAYLHIDNLERLKLCTIERPSRDLEQFVDQAARRERNRQRIQVPQ